MTTKKTNDEKDEKRLTWKLKNLPTVQEVKELQETGIITKDEARQLLFKEETPRSDTEVEAYEQMVKELQKMVQDLLNRPSQSIVQVPYTRVIEVPQRYTPYWEKVWMSSPGVVSTAQSLPNRSVAYNINATTIAGASGSAIS